MSLPSLIGKRAKLNVVLFQPQIHWNTGNIGRTCLGFDARLHLIKPYGFTLDDKHVQGDLPSECTDQPSDEHRLNIAAFYFTKFAQTSLLDVDFWSQKNKSPLEDGREGSEESVCLVFGSETDGLRQVRDQIEGETMLYIPQDSEHIRSYNLSNSDRVCSIDNKYSSSSRECVYSVNVCKIEPPSRSICGRVGYGARLKRKLTAKSW
ncbi:hypothetical protein PROFUN_06787 [Planoprotostelium fungivorum]|uniref:tRNA/rRNA methyltransferase SpoU type domain-containing protein n=1 Tax=Planoprotostelium fungivorum TaxID=1890364 RepID=A0A2P6NNL7_9EUKA|nr:hypothetical protein PROFUN_06787 [Planoprotostelium fungivorum]